MSGQTGTSTIPAWIKAHNQIGQLPTEGVLKELASTHGQIPDVRRPQQARYEPLSVKQQVGLFAPGTVILMTAEQFRLVNKGDGNIVVDSEARQATLLFTGNDSKESAPSTPIEVIRRKIKEQQSRARKLAQENEESDPLIKEAKGILSSDRRQATKSNPATDILRHIGKLGAGLGMVIKVSTSDAMHIVHSTHEERRRAKETKVSMPKGKTNNTGRFGMSKKQRSNHTAQNELPEQRAGRGTSSVG